MTNDRIEKATLVAAGYLNVDLIARVSTLPDRSERITADGIQRYLGGMAANVACVAARLGSPWPVHAELITVVGDDSESEWALSQLEERGVDTSWVQKRECSSITHCLILVEPDGERAVISEPIDFPVMLVNERVQTTTQQESAQLLHIDGYRIPGLLSHVASARQVGWRTSIDLDGLLAEWQNREGFAKLCKSFNVVFLNRTLARAIWPGVDSIEWYMKEVQAELINIIANQAFSRTGKCPDAPGGVVLTLGEDGAILFPYGGAPKYVPATQAPTVDATGAGDVFAGVFLASWINGERLIQAAQYASVAGALSTSGQGALGHLPTAADVLKALA